MSRRIGGRLILFAQIAGLSAMAWYVYKHAIAARHSTPGGALSFAYFLHHAGAFVSLGSVLLLWAASALLTFYVYLLASIEDPLDAVPLSIRSSAAGMWFAPAMLLLMGASPLSFSVSLLLAINTARVLVSRWPIRPARTNLIHRRPILSAVQIRTGFLSRKSLPALTAAFLLLAGIAAKLWRFSLASAAFVIGGAAIITALSLLSGASTQARAPKAPPSIFAIILTVLLSSMLSVGVIQIRQAAAGGNTAAAAKQVATKLYQPGSAKESFPGVVLKTQPKKQERVSAHLYLSESKSVASQSIEFSGEYWMLRPRYDRPPEDALISDSSPLDFIFRTTDSGPMKMEAHQRLERPIDLACCSMIDVVIEDTDHHAGTVALELILLDGTRTLSLGARVTGSEKAQTISFAVHAAAAMSRFDQIEVIFHRDPIRVDRSANISIQRFVLVP